MTCSAGTRLGPYEIVSALGSGGMGEVYLARDTRLDRAVAIKVLPSSDSELRARFEREAKAIAGLAHPHICALYDVGHQDGVDYLVMEYVDGETLAHRLLRGPLPIDEALRYGIEIAGALDKAHRKGIVHRDLKPSNVMITADGRTKVMDFGVAKRIAAAGADPGAMATMTGTVTGEIAGTLMYMSPEQLRGAAVDGRSDVFSFGLVLYEMVRGMHPFGGSSSIARIDAILNDPDPPLDRVLGDTPPLLAHVVSRCLAKDRDRRYQSMRDVEVELSSLIAAPPSSSRRRAAVAPGRRSSWAAAGMLTAVLAAGALLWQYGPPSIRFSQPALAFKERDWVLITDFENLTGDRVFDHSLRAALEVGIAQSQFVNVFPSSRVQDALKRMQKAAVDRIDEALASEVAKREGIAAVFAGSIAQVGGVYSLTARLIDPRSGLTVLTESVQATGKDRVLPALDRLATQMRRNLGESLAAVSHQSAPLPLVTTSSLEALNMYANSFHAERESDQTGDDLLRQALTLDPDFALAHAELGRREYLRPDPETRIEGEEHFVRALALLNRLTTRERLWIRAIAEDSRGNRQAAVDAYRTYLAQYPDDPRAWFRMGWTQMAGLGQYEAASEAFTRVIAFTPSDSGAYINLATCYGGLGRRREAVVEYGKAFALDPQELTGEFVNHEYGFTLVQLGELDRAADAFRTMIARREQGHQARGHRSLALLEMYRGRYAAAAVELRVAIQLDRAITAPISEFRDRLYLSRALEARGLTRESASELTAAEGLAARTSMGPEWLTMLAKIHARGGKLRQARALLTVMSKAASDTTAGSSANRNLSRDQAYLNLTRGEIAFAERRLDEAATLFDAAHVVEPRHPDTLESRAAVSVAAGRLDEAVKRYEELIARRPLGNEGQELWLRAHAQLGDVLQRVGRADAARQSYERLIATWKDADSNVVVLEETRAKLAKLITTARF